MPSPCCIFPVCTRMQHSGWSTPGAIHAIGLDTASIDFGQSAGFESHRILMAKGIPAFENVAIMDQLPASGFQVIALPMKITGGSGGPLRIVAVVRLKR